MHKLKEFIEESYTPNMQRWELREQRKEKRLASALRTKNIDAILEIDDE
jgi:hypothetical protein